MKEPAVVLDAAGVAAAVRACAEAIAPRIDDEAVAVCLLTGALWFAADLLRELDSLGRRPLFDALWLASYGDRREGAEVEVRASLQRPVRGRRVLLIEDVLDSGRSLKEAVRIARAGGAAEVLTAVFARKPWAGEREVAADFVAWNAPARWLVGYGMDERGRFRGLPYVGALD